MGAVDVVPDSINGKHAGSECMTNNLPDTESIHIEGRNSVESVV